MKRILGNSPGGIIAGVVWLGSTMLAFAQTAGGSGGGNISLINPLGNNSTVNGVLGSIGAFLLALAVPICGIMVIVGAFQMMTAAGDPTKFGNGKKTLLYAAVGFVIVLFASSVVPLLKSILGG